MLASAAENLSPPTAAATASAAPNHWQRHPWAVGAALWCGVHALWLMIAMVGVRWQFDLTRYPFFDAQGHGYYYTPYQAIDMWLRWDAPFYLRIATENYGNDMGNLRAAFFPLWPMCIAGAAAATGWPHYLCGFILGNLFDLVGWMLVATWLQKRANGYGGWLAMLLFALFPVAISASRCTPKASFYS